MGRTANTRVLSSKDPVRDVDIVMSTEGMADFLGLTTRRLTAMVSEGIVPAMGRGRFDLKAVSQAYTAFLKEGARERSGTTSMDILREKKAQEIDMNMAKKDRQLISLEEAMGTLDEVSGDFLALLSGLPAQITRTVRERQRIEAIIDESKQRFADRYAKKASALRTGGEDADPEAED